MNKLRTFALTTLTSTALSCGAWAGTPDNVSKEVIQEPPPVSRINLLLNVDFSNEYVTPRGMIVRDKGLTVQPLLLAFITLYKDNNTFVNSFKLVGGMWNDFGTSQVSRQPPFGSNPKTNYTEIDPIAGISVDFAKYFTLDVTYTAFVEQILSIGTSHHLETKLSLNDSDFLHAFALHPYASFWYELAGKATDADVPEAVLGPSPRSGKHPAPGSSFYFDIGIDPSYTIKSLGGLTIEAPCRVLLPDSRFYGEYYGSSSTVGLFELGGKATLPIKCIPGSYGHWSVHAGIRYMNFVDDNLYHLNTFNAPGEPTRTTLQGYGGVSVFF